MPFVKSATALFAVLMTAAAFAQSTGIDSALLAKAKGGDAKSQSLIGEEYLNGFSKNGIFVGQDFAQALFWSRKLPNKTNR